MIIYWNKMFILVFFSMFVLNKVFYKFCECDVMVILFIMMCCIWLLCKNNVFFNMWKCEIKYFIYVIRKKLFEWIFDDDEFFVWGNDCCDYVEWKVWKGFDIFF